MHKRDENNCAHLLSSISDYIDGILTDELCQELERHIAGCRDCRVVVDTLQKTVLLFHGVGEESVVTPPLVRERLYHILNLDDYLK